MKILQIAMPIHKSSSSSNPFLLKMGSRNFDKFDNYRPDINPFIIYVNFLQLWISKVWIREGLGIILKDQLASS